MSPVWRFITDFIVSESLPFPLRIYRHHSMCVLSSFRHSVLFTKLYDSIPRSLERVCLRTLHFIPGDPQDLHRIRYWRYDFSFYRKASDTHDTPDHAVIFILRLYSIYSRSVPILVSFSILLLAELGTKIVGLRFK